MLTLGPEFKVSPSLFGTAPLVRTNSEHSLFFSKQIPSGTGRVLYKRSAGGTSSSGKEIVRAEKGPHDLPLGYSQKHVAAHGCMVWRGPSSVSARSCTCQTIYCTYYILVSKCLLEDMKNHGFSHISKTKKQPFRNYYMEKIDQLSTQEGNVAKLRLTKKPLNNSRGNKTKIFTDHEKTLYHLLGWA